ncbi:5'-methylthioadenosine/S-adenosylhomocysteine nucleosidase [Microbacterium amylolyticum]|uniref:adenosylhomocysteine nucleosidase n=1 Tax=Microbacterium amylolyticum TaxID=936337 RepID=A0ABS4ZJB4_9MICO|nr:5'-methylthioadenosine/S-adenosylhomocysteine nucleosidase [Microbacterium amylolyticum]MBP2437382.1 adenosylhomocysteine nucleosidase [Microbacterium amylolyticum]
MTAIVIQVAMEEEAQPFLDAASEVSEPFTVGGAEHRGIVIGGATVVLVRSGIGMVNATAAATGALHRYGPDGVVLISAGSAGGLAAGIQVGDVVIADHTVNVEASALAFGYVPGQVPGMPATYDTDPQLAQAFADTRIDDISVRHGAMGSGDKFATNDIAVGLRETFPQLLTIDMETSAIVATARAYGVRCAAVRAVSDLCAPDGSEFATHIDGAAERSARVVIDGLARLAA